jgi:hypothetical protein
MGAWLDTRDNNVQWNSPIVLRRPLSLPKPTPTEIQKCPESYKPLLTSAVVGGV